MTEQLSDIGQAQRERLFHIDFRAEFLGTVARADIVRRFGISEPAVTRDLTLYRALAPANLVFDQPRKIYRRSDAFVGLFRHDPLQVLTAIADGFGDDTVAPTGPHVRTERPLRLNQPALPVISAVSRAITQRRALRLLYVSLSTGETEREIVPHALVDNGTRWHARAFDRRRGGFRDFVLTRMDAPTELETGPGNGEDREADDQWMRIVELELVPHPGLERPRAVEIDYAMRDGCLPVRLRAALVGYALLHWGIDATADHRLDPDRHQLWLQNLPALYGVENLDIAPGYTATL